MKKNLIFSIIGLVLFFVLLKVLCNGRSDTNSSKFQSKLSSFSITHKNDFYGSSSDQVFDFYQSGATSDTSLKSLVILLHSGAFVTGDKRDDEIVELAESLARRGIHVAAINYSKVKIDGDFLDFRSPIGVIKDKMFKSFQELSLAVRFFRDRHNSYKVDRDRIFVAGYSAGGIISLSTSYIDEDDFTKYFDASCLHCLGRSDSQFRVNGVISISGAMFDRLSIDQNDNVPSLLIHGSEDGIVPYNKGKPFESFTKGIELDIPGISHQLAIGEDRVIYDPKFVFQEQYLKLFRNSVFPELYGPGIISERMRDNNISVQIKRINRGSHNLFYNSNGTETKYSKEIVQSIVQFVNKHS